jgi:hypothetical protein
MPNMTIDKLQELTDILDSASVPVEDRMGFWWDVENGEYIIFTSEESVCQQFEG